MDFDLCAAWDLDNLGRLVDALRELGAELRVRPGVQPPTVDAHLLHDSVVTTWRTTAGDIDVLVGIPSSPQAGLLGQASTLIPPVSGRCQCEVWHR